MSIRGKKINELESTTELTDDSVLPILIINAGIPESKAKQVTLAELSSYFGGGGSGLAPTSYEYTSEDWVISADNTVLSVLDTTDAVAVWVFRNGVKLRQDTTAVSLDRDYWLSGTTLRFNVPLDNTDIITLEVF